MKTPYDSGAQLAPFNVLRNLITIVTKATKNDDTNLAIQPALKAEQNAVEQDDHDDDNTVLDFSKVQESAVTENETFIVKTPTDSEAQAQAQLAPFNVLRNFITIAAKATKLVITNSAEQPAKSTEQNTVEEKEDDEDNAVLKFSSGSAQETESTGW